jgi:taspase (threonine aspartase 1)
VPLQTSDVPLAEEVKNPISAARVVLDGQSKRLSLQRVPPNILVGPGATDYAYDHGITVLPSDFLVSQTARARWLRWQHDVDAARQKELEDLLDPEEAPRPNQGDINMYSVGNSTIVHPAQLMSPPPSVQPKQQGALLSATNTSGDDSMAMVADSSDNSYTTCHSIASPNPNQQIGPNYNIPSEGKHGSDGSFEEHKLASLHSNDQSAGHGTDRSLASINSGSRVSFNSSSTVAPHLVPLPPSGTPSRVSVSQTEAAQSEGPPRSLPRESSQNQDDGNDDITDTVGAIAVDCYGNIAAGSSSGGIGMKHRGRVGPAALVGIGTAVIPVDPNDPDRTCAAAVTSGTGEHMATTLAASTCASRIYFSQRKGENGMPEEVTEDEALKAMIEVDFMGKSSSPVKTPERTWATDYSTYHD